jgi:hypothetical protein
MGAVRIIIFTLAFLLGESPLTTKAADLYGGPNGRGMYNCPYVESANALRRTGDIRVLRSELYSRYYHAIDVFHSAVYSASPAFVWANETKIACAKAIGYLKLGHFRREIDIEMIQKCECFHARMVWFLGHPAAVSG